MLLYIQIEAMHTETDDKFTVMVSKALTKKLLKVGFEQVYQERTEHSLENANKP